MNHPNPDEWMSYLYDELPGRQRAQLSAHLAACPECRRQVTAWRGTQQELDTWNPPVRTAPAFTWPQAVRWAAAAVVLLGLGFGLAHAVNPAPDPAALRAEIEQAVEARWRAAWQAELATLTDRQQTQRLEDQQQLVQTLRQMEAQRTSDYALLRQELETVAVTAENSWQTARQQLARLLAASSPPESSAAQTP